MVQIHIEIGDDGRTVLREHGTRVFECFFESESAAVSTVHDHLGVVMRPLREPRVRLEEIVQLQHVWIRQVKSEACIKLLLPGRVFVIVILEHQM